MTEDHAAGYSGTVMVDYTVLYHLTPTGWVAGSTWFYDKLQSDVPAPPGRIETWRVHETQASEWSPSHYEWWCVWESPDHTPEDRERLRGRFPPPPSYPKMCGSS